MAGTNNALQKPVNLSPELENVVGKGPMTRAQVSGVISEDLVSTAHPAASAGAASIRNRVIGKFHGMISPTNG